MDHPLIDLINARIAAAEKDGAFDNLPGAGKPLPRSDDPENELINRILKENGAVPEFVSLSRELERLRVELRETGDRTRRSEILKEMSMMDARIELARKAYRK
ncbi:DnaJ family domain-containing protein [Roseobacteraceae bacterium NS-SX3]